MPLIWKEIIRPGTYWYVDQHSQRPRKLTVTTDGVRHLHDRGNDMLAAGLSVPIPVEHQTDARAMTQAERATQQLLNNSGWVKRYALRGDRLFGLCDIQDMETYRKLPRTIRYTSPWINSFTDGDGKQWDGVISHLALTSRPRITRQEPFQTSIAAALSIGAAEPVLTLGATPLNSEGGVWLSRAGLLDGDGASLKPHYPLAFSLYSGVCLAVPPPEKEKVASKEMEGEKKVKEKDGPPDEDADREKERDDPLGKLEEDVEEMDLVEVACDLAAALWGIELPEETDESNLAQNLIRALTDHIRNEKGNARPEGDTTNQPPGPGKTGNQTPPNPPIKQEPQPMFMSLEEIQQIDDPRLKATATMAFNLRQNLIDGHAVTRSQRVERLAKRLKPQARDSLLQMAQNAPLSMNDAGKIVDPLEATLSLLEASAVDLPALLTTPAAQLAVVDHPRDMTGELSEERRQQIVNEQCKNTGLREPPRQAS